MKQNIYYLLLALLISINILCCNSIGINNMVDTTKYNLALESINEDDINKLDLLLNENNIDFINGYEFDEPLLFPAIKKQRYDIIELLLEQKADILKKYFYGEFCTEFTTPYSLVKKLKDIRLLKLFLLKKIEHAEENNYLREAFDLDKYYDNMNYEFTEYCIDKMYIIQKYHIGFDNNDINNKIGYFLKYNKDLYSLIKSYLYDHTKPFNNLEVSSFVLDELFENKQFKIIDKIRKFTKLLKMEYQLTISYDGNRSIFSNFYKSLSEHKKKYKEDYLFYIKSVMSISLLLLFLYFEKTDSYYNSINKYLYAESISDLLIINMLYESYKYDKNFLSLNEELKSIYFLGKLILNIITILFIPNLIIILLIYSFSGIFYFIKKYFNKKNLK